jgi:hypothetical protein
MSYDLTFAHPADSAPMTQDAFESYFGSRAHYAMNGTQAWYSNEDTGVYFSFDFDPQTVPPDDWADFADDDGVIEEWFPSIASFNINYNRPSFFAAEAAPEIAAFVENFNLIVDDPQIDGMGRGTFSMEKFATGWNKGNSWATSAVRLNSESDTPLTYPAQRLLGAWRWNLSRSDRQSQIGESIFIPKISFGTRSGQVSTFAVWPDAIPTLLPQVDFVLIVRDELARRRWFGTKKTETLAAPWEAIETELSAFQHSKDPLFHFRIEYDRPTPKVIELVKREWPAVSKETFSGVSPDKVLDSEFFSA